MKTILVPTDFSANAENALLYAAGLANFIHAKLLLVHVFYFQENTPALELDSNDPKIKACKERIETTIRRIQNQHRFFFEFETLCLYSENLLILNEIIKQNNVQLAVMGSKGCSDYFDKMMGSNTLELMQKALCPVLAIPSKARFTAIKKIVYASDFATEETIFLKQLFVFAGLFQAEILIVNVETGNLPEEPSDEENTCTVNPDFSGQNYTIFQVEDKDVAQGILHFTEANGVEMLAISIHERSVLEALFHKSVAKTLVFSTSVPLLALPEKPYYILPPIGTVDQIKSALLKKY